MFQNSSEWGDDEWHNDDSFFDADTLEQSLARDGINAHDDDDDTQFEAWHEESFSIANDIVSDDFPPGNVEYTSHDDTSSRSKRTRKVSATTRKFSQIQTRITEEELSRSGHGQAAQRGAHQEPLDGRNQHANNVEVKDASLADEGRLKDTMELALQGGKGMGRLAQHGQDQEQDHHGRIGGDITKQKVARKPSCSTPRVYSCHVCRSEFKRKRGNGDMTDDCSVFFFYEARQCQ